MLLYSFPFFIFFAFVWILYWKLSNSVRWILLLASSYYFYGSYKPAYLGIILLTTIVNYVSARAMCRYPRYKNQHLLFAICLNIGLLIVFKYFNFFSFTIQQMIHVNFPHVKALLPIGISFSTLQSIGYLLDVRSGKVKPEKHFGYFAIFSCFFPQLSAGPIQRAGTLLTQLQKKQVFQYGQVADGAKRFLFGLFKKIVIADNLGSVVDRIFASLPEYKGISLIFTMFLYTWQIYMDFSGYTDMARGTAQMLGITLTENFRLPYFATSLRDFWKRWHISLSSWLRDYLYIPLGGNRHGLIRTVINTLLVFTISGLWHGAAWNFVLWGFLYGVMLSLEKLLKKIAENRIVIPTNIKILYTYSVISILWVFFRAPTIQDALYILRNSFVGMKHFFSPEYLLASINQIFVFNHAEILIISVLLILAMIIEYIRRKTSLLQLINRQPMLLRFVFYSLILLAIIQLRNARIQEFIYVQF